MIAFTSVAESRFALHQTAEVKTPAPAPEKTCRKPCAPGDCQVSISPQAQAKSQEVAVERGLEVQKTEPNPYASAIIGYIEAQLLRDVADGATPAELQSRLQAGVDGFLAGYGEALAQLQHQPGFTGAIESEIAQTQTQVLEALNALADELELQPPVVAAKQPAEQPVSAPEPAPQVDLAAPVDAVAAARDHLVADKGTSDIALLVDTLERTTLTYEHLGKTKKSTAMTQAYRSLETRSFTLELKTLDGDKVNLTIRSEKSSDASLVGAGNFNTTTQGKDQLSFSVEGELDEGELRAISELLADVNSLADEFYQGDYAQALLEAQKVRFDDAELASFDLDLKQTQIETYSRASGEQQPAAVESDGGLRNDGLKSYARELLLDAGRSIHLGYRASLIVEFVEQIELLADRNGLADFSRDLLQRHGFE